ncbi:MAG: nitrous oxide reductase family maturation protein NosD [Arcobacteraceae bacterium]|nr:nitrous oxide reductase family maturation protein NosD [Arcobacteraceae bacterium]
MNKFLKLFSKLFLLSLIFISSTFANVLQDAIDNAPSGSTLKLPDGIYLGKIVINKPITIIGTKYGAVIKGDNKGKVITINSSNVVLKNLTITNSGNRMENLDSAIVMNKVKDCEISDCKILNSLYGIDMIMVENSIISNNYITSKNNDISLRGDALKIWYSNNNIIKNNIIENSRDVTLTYSNNNKLINNTFKNNRFGLHIHLSEKNLVQNNTYKYNSVAIMVMGTKDSRIINNQIKSSKGAAGMGIVIMECSNLHFENNIVSYNAQGIYIDSKNTEEGMQRYIKNNEISYNGEAIHFHEAIKNNTITNNKIFGNIDDIVKDVRGIFTSANIIEYNYWDRYAGFDRNSDNIGDTPYQVYQYADQLWHYNHKIKFFYASPVMTLMNFLANLAPFVEPIMLLEDTKPIVHME